MACLKQIDLNPYYQLNSYKRRRLGVVTIWNIKHSHKMTNELETKALRWKRLFEAQKNSYSSSFDYYLVFAHKWTAKTKQKYFWKKSADWNRSLNS